MPNIINWKLFVQSFNIMVLLDIFNLSIITKVLVLLLSQVLFLCLPMMIMLTLSTRWLMENMIIMIFSLLILFSASSIGESTFNSSFQLVIFLGFVIREFKNGSLVKKIILIVGFIIG